MAGKIIKVHCNKCGGERRHEILHNENVTWNEVVDDHNTIDGGDSYDLVKCCGCENVALRHQSWFSEESDEHGRPYVKTVMYPPESYRQEPRWMTQLFFAMPIDNNFVGDFIKEIYVALRNKSLRLAVMGIRALLEQVMIDKVGDKGTFKKNLDAFERAGFVSNGQRAVLEPVLEAGHATMHRSFKPTTMDVGHLMDITESIIESIYINERRASELSKRVPPRPSNGNDESSA
jgi:hypothetical protein